MKCQANNAINNQLIDCFIFIQLNIGIEAGDKTITKIEINVN